MNNANGFVLVSLFLTLWRYFTPCSTVCIISFEHVIAGWDEIRDNAMWNWVRKINPTGVNRALESCVLYN